MPAGWTGLRARPLLPGRWTALDVLLDNARAKVPNLATSACGQLPIAALLMMMEERDELEIRHLDYRNSGDAAVYGDKSEVVGYHAFSVVYKEGAEKNTGTSGGFSLRIPGPRGDSP